ncbi:spinster family MFS transporter [Hyphomonas adhaerens]|uniref:spinster family MFS transporter n=1 Tax=Hyphomonas adhaerens TaxID=81029 RepID=UPI00235334C8|nr:MFS transporter [Hyphomonas adhaerens]
MSDTTAGQAAQPGHITGFGTKPYRSYVLIALTLVYTLNFIDRTVITVVAQPIIDTFSLSDAQWGVLTGWPFALFYAGMGIPIAMWADRGNRVKIITFCIIIWSLMTVFCGLASGFLWLLLFRVGVGIGEAGCTPPANSLIGDYYPAKSRANAIGIYSMGVTLGGVLAQLFGGTIASIKGEDMGAWIQSFGMGGLFSGLDWAEVQGWRFAFILVGAPGLIVALIIWLTMREPPRGHSDEKSTTPETKAGFAEAFKEFGKKPTFWTLSLGAAFVAFAGYGLISFQAPFLMRVHGVSVHEAAVRYGAPLAAVAAFGTFLGGFLSERLSGRFPSVAAWLPSVGLTIAVPCYVAAFLSPTLPMAFALWIVAAIGHYAYLGAQYTVSVAIVSPKSRATTVSVMLLIVSLIGNGIGPFFTGLMSTSFMKGIIRSEGLDTSFHRFDLCAGKIAEIGPEGPALCSAYSEGLRQSMIATVLFLLVAAVFYFLAGRTFARDRWSANSN